MSKETLTMNPHWTRGVYVDGVKSSETTTSIAAMGQHVHADLVKALGLAIPRTFGITTAAHNIGEEGTLLVIRLRASVNDPYMRHYDLLKAIAGFIRERMDMHATADGVGGVGPRGVTYFGMIVFVKGADEVVADFSHIA